MNRISQQLKTRFNNASLFHKATMIGSGLVIASGLLVVTPLAVSRIVHPQCTTGDSLKSAEAWKQSWEQSEYCMKPSDYVKRSAGIKDDVSEPATGAEEKIGVATVDVPLPRPRPDTPTVKTELNQTAQITNLSKSKPVEKSSIERQIAAGDGFVVYNNLVEVARFIQRKDHRSGELLRNMGRIKMASKGLTDLSKRQVGCLMAEQIQFIFNSPAYPELNAGSRALVREMTRYSAPENCP